MEILLAESLGFCMGVKRAVDMAYRAQSKSGGQPVVTLGPLIHNQQEIERLERDGIRVATASAPIQNGVVIIRAHGVAPQVYDDLKAQGLKIMDGTCPYVHYSQRRAVELKNAGYEVVIVGDKNHPEIIGILGHLGGQAHVVKSVDEARGLPAMQRVGTVAQTTLSPQKYQAVVAALRERMREVKVCETICDATEENQAAVRRLAAEVEVLYVIGGRHSANSNKLVEQALQFCPRSMLIETADEIDPQELRGVKRVGVSAGASTPDWMIQRVVTRLREIDRQVNASDAV
ncbi:MAG TPA: 4-hydroxy-3-methylbut-2-enyl diphosphate reductase [Blastocatellia bacterium]|nr:4-hydroxy-3-methylbut-2-enyl diphosphate reductase [Blastocatellia bacterium]